MLKTDTVVTGPASASKTQCNIIATSNANIASCKVSATAWCCTPTPVKHDYGYYGGGGYGGGYGGPYGGGNGGYYGGYNPGYGKMD